MNVRALLLVVSLVSCGKSGDVAPAATCSADQDAVEGDCIAGVPSCTGRTVPASGACVPVGLRADDCAKGFSWDEATGSCTPILPAESCGPGVMAVPGDTACRPVAPCGSDRYPTVTGDVAYVDASAAAGGDGTAEKPFTTISDALAKTTSATIAVAAGRYEEVVNFADERTVIGVCPDKVEIAAPAGSKWVVGMQYGGTLANVAVTGSAIGASVCEGKIVLDHVWIHDTAPYRGVEVAVCPTETELEVNGSLIEHAGDHGIIGVLGTATIKNTAVRDTVTNADTKGPGIWWQWDRRAKGPQTLTVQGSLVERNKTAGIYAASVPLVIDGTAVRANRPVGSTLNGRGVFVGQTPGGPAEKVVVRRSHFLDNRGEAISIGASEFEIEAVTVALTSLAGGGGSLVVQEGAHGVATRLLIEDSGPAGVTLVGGELTLRDSLVRRSRGIGVHAQPYLVYKPDPTKLVLVPSKLDLEHLLVDGAGHFAGVLLMGMPVLARGLVVRDVHPQDGLYGDGVAATFIPGGPTATLDFEDVVVENAARAGIGLFGADLTIHRSRMRCNGFEIDIETAGGFSGERDPTLVDSGDNACGCGTPERCHASSAALTPIGPS
ncbi:MAG: hypothetical protein ACXWUG_18490 [Polyangiales bacterium]